jgi:hypothetical protein
MLQNIKNFDKLFKEDNLNENMKKGVIFWIILSVLVIGLVVMSFQYFTLKKAYNNYECKQEIMPFYPVTINISEQISKSRDLPAEDLTELEIINNQQGTLVCYGVLWESASAHCSLSRLTNCTKIWDKKFYYAYPNNQKAEFSLYECGDDYYEKGVGWEDYSKKSELYFHKLIKDSRSILESESLIKIKNYNEVKIALGV